MAKCKCGHELTAEWEVLCDGPGGDPPRVEITRFCPNCDNPEEGWVWLGDVLQMLASKLGLEDDVWNECVQTSPVEAVAE